MRTPNLPPICSAENTNTRGIEPPPRTKEHHRTRQNKPPQRTGNKRTPLLFSGQIEKGLHTVASSKSLGRRRWRRGGDGELLLRLLAEELFVMAEENPRRDTGVGGGKGELEEELVGLGGGSFHHPVVEEGGEEVLGGGDERPEGRLRSQSSREERREDHLLVVTVAMLVGILLMRHEREGKGTYIAASKLPHNPNPS